MCVRARRGVGRGGGAPSRPAHPRAPHPASPRTPHAQRLGDGGCVQRLCPPRVLKHPRLRLGQRRWRRAGGGRHARVHVCVGGTRGGTANGGREAARDGGASKSPPAFWSPPLLAAPVLQAPPTPHALHGAMLLLRREWAAGWALERPSLAGIAARRAGAPRDRRTTLSTTPHPAEAQCTHSQGAVSRCPYPPASRPRQIILVSLLHHREAVQVAQRE